MKQLDLEKKLKYIKILAFLLLSLGSIYAQDFPSTKEMPCGMTNENFLVGEKLTYTVYYNWGYLWISAGEVTFEVNQAGDQYHFICNGTTYKRYDSVFKVRDYFESKVDTATLLPTHFLRDVEEGKYIRYDSIAFDQEEYIVKEYIGKTKNNAKEQSFTLDHCTHDLLSIIYALRNTDVDVLSPGDKLPMDVFFDKELFSLNLNYTEQISKKKIKELGKYNVTVFQPTLVTGNVFTEEAVMNIYISDDDNKIPLLIESPVTVGSVKAVLSSYEGLKYPLVEAK